MTPKQNLPKEYHPGHQQEKRPGDQRTPGAGFQERVTKCNQLKNKRSWTVWKMKLKRPLGHQDTKSEATLLPYIRLRTHSCSEAGWQQHHAVGMFLIRRTEKLARVKGRMDGAKEKQETFMLVVF